MQANIKNAWFSTSKHSQAVKVSVMATAAQKELLAQAHALAERAQLYDSTLETDHTSERTAGKPLAGENAVGLIKTNCETVFNNMIGMHEQIAEQRNTQSAEGNQAFRKIREAKMNRLKAEIQSLREKQPQPLPQDKDALHALVKNDLQKSISQLQETLSLVRSQRKEIEADIEKEKSYLDQHTSIEAMLEEKLQEEHGREPLDAMGQVAELDKKVKGAVVHQKELTKQMMKFVKEHYPAPTQEESTRWRKKHGSASFSDGNTTSMSVAHPNNFVPLETILEKLMNACVDQPRDPYIDLDSTVWPPYIELLLRCQIAVKHPEDDKKMKLVPFHL